MEQILTSLENHQGAAVCVAIFIIVILDRIVRLINITKKK
jgi:hypothetical protein